MTQSDADAETELGSVGAHSLADAAQSERESNTEIQRDSHT